jgi:putative nucleotidyltransferase with HDIG domain
MRAASQGGTIMAIVLSRKHELEPDPYDSREDLETEEYQTRLELLCEIAEEATSISEVSSLLERILLTTRQTLRVSAVMLFLADSENGSLCTHGTVGDCDVLTAAEKAAVESEIAEWVANFRTPLIIDDLSRDVRFGQGVEEDTGGAVTSVIAVPIVRGRQTVGVLAGVKKATHGRLGEWELQVMDGFASTEALVLLASMASIAIANINRVALDQALVNGYRSIAEALATTADVKDSYAFAHSRRVKEYSLLAARCLSMSPHEMQAIEFGALLHDIGKIGIETEILCKPGPLSEEEWAIMHEHSLRGAEILGEIAFLKDARNIVLYHHERYDGKGYPEGLKGESIPLGARLVAVADAFDTMTTDHSYRSSLTVNDAMKALKDGIGTQFCPVAVEAFIAAFKKHYGKVPHAKPARKEKPVETPEPAGFRERFKSVLPEPDLDSEVFKGCVRVLVPLTIRASKLESFSRNLKIIEGLKIVAIGSDEKEGHFIVVSLEKPMTLMRSISAIPSISSINRKGKDVAVTFEEAA